MKATAKVIGIIQEHFIVMILALALGILTGGWDILTAGSLTVLVIGFLGMAILVSMIVVAIRETSLRAMFNVVKILLPRVAVVVLPYISGALVGWLMIS